MLRVIKRLCASSASRIHEDPNALGYHLMAGGSGAPRKPRNVLLDVAPASVWREIEKAALR